MVLPARMRGASKVKSRSAVKAKVREPLCARDELALVAEFEAWREPKTLTPAALRALMERFGSSHRAADVIGASEAIVRQNGKETPMREKASKVQNRRSPVPGRPRNRPSKI